MPLTEKGREILTSLEQQFGKSSRADSSETKIDRCLKRLMERRSAGSATITGMVDGRLAKLDAAAKSLRELAADSRRLRGRADAEFREADHPRAEDGKFGSGGGGKSVAAKHTAFRPGAVSVRDEIPGGAAGADGESAYDEHEFEDEETGQSYSFDVGYVEAESDVEAVIANIHVLDEETDEFIPLDEAKLNRVEKYKIRKKIEKGVAADYLPDVAESATEESRQKSLTIEEKKAEAAEDQRKRAEESSQRAAGVRDEVDKALKAGWKPKVDETGRVLLGGTAAPPKELQMVSASPKGARALREHLKDLGIGTRVDSACRRQTA